MKVYDDVEQMTPEWFRLRSGVLTASHASDVVTPAALRAAKFGAYFHKMVAEIFCGSPESTVPDTGWMERGREMEPRARAWLSMEFDTVEEVGFIRSDDKRTGASPDGLMRDRTVYCEIKVPSRHNHTGYALNNALLLKDHEMQVQFGMWVSGIEQGLLCSWHPSIDPVVLWLEPSDKHVAAFDEHVPKFLARVDEAVESLRLMAMGADPSNATEEEREAARLFA